MSDFGKILYICFIAVCFVLAAMYLWPLILVLIAFVWYHIYKVKKAMKDAGFEEMKFEEPVDLYEEVEHAHQGDVIDATFSEHEEKVNDRV